MGAQDYESGTADALGSGLIASLARSGGNTTGLSIVATDLTAKRLELLKKVMPQAIRIVILQQPGNPVHSMFIKEIEPAAGLLGFSYRILQARGSEDFEPSFALMRAWPIVLGADPDPNIRAYLLKPAFTE